MNKHELRDSRGIYIGAITTESSGKQTLRDARGIFRGTYDPSTNTTRDERGLFVGTGNQITTLLPR